MGSSRWFRSFRFLSSSSSFSLSHFSSLFIAFSQIFVDVYISSHQKLKASKTALQERTPKTPSLPSAAPTTSSFPCSRRTSDCRPEGDQRRKSSILVVPSRARYPCLRRKKGRTSISIFVRATKKEKRDSPDGASNSRALVVSYRATVAVEIGPGMVGWWKRRFVGVFGHCPGLEGR